MGTTIRIISFVLLMIAFAPIVANAKTSSVVEYSLSNGLKILVKEDHRAKVAIAQVWYKIGSSYELTGTTGISHALEHMMFRGSKKYAHLVLDKIVVENGGINNAFTGQDFTCYHETLPSDKLSIAFDLEADRMRNLLLDNKGFAEEMQIVMEERKMSVEDSPESQLQERFMAAAFASNPYRTPIIGWMHDIKNLTITNLKNWYQNWYAPNNAILVVVGDVVPEKILQMAKKYFGELQPSKLMEVKPQQEITTLGNRNIVVKVPAKVPSLTMGYNVPSLKTLDQNQRWKAYALDVVSSLLSSGDSSRLPKELVRKKQIAASIGASYNLYDRLDTVFVLSANPTAQHTTKELEIALLEEIKKLQTTLVGEEELQRIKIQIISHQTYKKDFIAAQAFEIGSLAAVDLPWQLADEYVEKIKAVTSKQIQDVAREYFIPDRLILAELQPQLISNKKN